MVISDDRTANSDTVTQILIRMASKMPMSTARKDKGEPRVEMERMRGRFIHNGLPVKTQGIMSKK